MELKALSNSQLISQLDKLVRSERKITHAVLLHINEIESRKIYLDLGFGGMYAYLTKGLGYSDGSAYRRLQAARLLKQVPTIGEKIESGSLNLSQLTQAKKCLDKKFEDQKTDIRNLPALAVAELNSSTISLLEKLEHKNSFETLQTLANELDLPIENAERIRPQSGDSVRIELTLTAEQFADLETSKYLLSHVCPAGKWADIIGILAKNFNKKKTTGRTLLTHSVVAGKSGIPA